MNPEVRYHMMRPDQIVRRRTECPVVYIPIGLLEWHGVHNATGADALQAEGLAIRCAQRGGGLVFPPLYYGEERTDAVMEARAPDRKLIAERMGLDPDNFQADRFPYTLTEQYGHYNHLLQHILAQADTLGFRVGVLVVGHYPLLDHARAAVLQFNQRHLKSGRMLAWTFADYLLLRDRYDVAGDHAAGWETSHMLALHPETVDLSRLAEDRQPPVGVGGKMPPQDATAAFGNEILDAAAEAAVREVRDRLEHTERYRQHGLSLSEGQWR